MFQLILMNRKYLSIIAFIFISGQPVSATEVLQLINTLTIDHDSIRITSVNPVGDFNNDGYNDMAISFYDPSPGTKFEAVYLYYGGPNFDTQPDLIFYGDTLGCCPGENITAFGSPRGLRDFNGDGYDDIAISAAAYCRGWYTGRIYIFLGSINPDTMADIIIDGNQAEDHLGCNNGGDFNGDGLGDFIAYASNNAYGHKLFIYQGGDPPDTICDWSYIYQEQQVEDIKGPVNLNNDGYQDFYWSLYIDTIIQSYIFWGNDSLSQSHIDTLLSTPVLFPGDISGDNIDDFMIVVTDPPYQPGWYLCLGGDSIDYNPDYYMWYYPSDCFIYHAVNQVTRLIRNLEDYHQLMVYNTVIPFDTLPKAIFDYGNQYWGRTINNIGDMNADGYDEIVMQGRSNDYIDLYSIITTGIEEHDNSELPAKPTLIYCYPNPFNSATVIVIDNLDDKDGKTDLKIYNLLGQLINCQSVPKKHDNQSIKIIWKGIDSLGNPISNGIYFICLNVNNKPLTTKAIYLK